MIPILAALISAVCFYFGMGLHDAWPLAWIAPLPILWLAYGDEKGWRVWLAAFFAAAAGHLWLYVAYGRVMGPRILIMAIAIGVLFASLTLLSRRAARRLPAWIGWLAFPALWTTGELAISYLPDGTFGSFAYSQVGQPLLIQSASVFGLWSISFLIIAVASGVALSLRTRRSAPAVIVLALFALNLGFGALRLSRAPAGPRASVAAVAKDLDSYLDMAGRTDPAVDEKTVQAEAAMARALAARGARYVVFSEKAAVVRPDWRARLYAPLQQAADDTGAVIVAGFDQMGPDRRNLAVVFSPHAAPYGYAKRHMVPGLESMFVPGPGAGVFAPGVATVVCKDMDFQATLREDTRSGVGLMLVPAWDFQSDDWVHARMAILRGVEDGFALVRSAKEGLVTVSDAQGRILARARSAPRDYAAAAASVPVGPGHTLYQQIGDAFAWVCALVAAGLVLAGFAFRPRG